MSNPMLKPPISRRIGPVEDDIVRTGYLLKLRKEKKRSLPSSRDYMSDPIASMSESGVDKGTAYPEPIIDWTGGNAGRDSVSDNSIASAAWKVKWFVLEPDRLWWYKTQQHSTPSGYIDMKHTKIRSVSSSAAGEEFCFEIVTPDRVFAFVARSPQLMQEWLIDLTEFTTHDPSNALILEAEQEIQYIENRRKSEVSSSSFSLKL